MNSCNIPNCQLCGTSGWAADWQSIGYVDDPDGMFTKGQLDAAAELKRKQEEEYERYVAGLPKEAGAIRMFRTWKLLADGSLKAMVADHIWKPGENVTLASGGDASKDSGFYGFTSMEELKRQEKRWWEKSQSGEQVVYDDLRGASPAGYWYVCGTMLCYGHCKLSEKGGRVQKAIPEYIIEPTGADLDFGMLVLKAAEKYGMKIMSIEDAKELKPGFVPFVKDKD